MTDLFLIAASAVMTVTSAPVIAPEPVVTTAPVGQPVVSRAANPNQRYCIIDTITGSHIPIRTCQTRADWLHEGFDPLNPGK